MMSTTIIIGIIVLLGYVMYIAFKITDDKNREDTALLRKQQAQFIENKVAEKEIEEEPEAEPLYQFQTHKMRYLLYNQCFDLRYLTFLYKDVVLENLWINEPFHSKFYEILMILDQNEFMIIDPNSKVITMSVRDKNNETHVSKSYQVFATKDIVKATIREAKRNIVRFQKYDSQHILLAVCIMALEQSVHYASKQVAENTIEKLLKNYQYANDIEYIIELIKQKEQKLLFVESAFKEAFRTTPTLPYNDSEVPKALQISIKLPQKFLQEI